MKKLITEDRSSLSGREAKRFKQSDDREGEGEEVSLSKFGK